MDEIGGSKMDSKTPRILFVGLGHSSHTQSWIGLLDGSNFSARLFCTSEQSPPDDWTVYSYVWGVKSLRQPQTRASLYDQQRLRRAMHLLAARIRRREWHPAWLANDWLREILIDWQPQIVHTFGLDAARFYVNASRRSVKAPRPRWVAQTRGGSDLQLAHLDPEARSEIASLLKDCDQLICDNTFNFRIARQLGLADQQISSIGTVPGTGGVDVEVIAAQCKEKPARRRRILWPKAYECPWSKSLPVLEALKLCWDQIQPCSIEMLAACRETRMYYWTLPDSIRSGVELYERVPRSRSLKAMTEARVMLAPSLVDGVPNSMFEAMAAGALPIVSPIESIQSVVKDQQNVLFARNLYPEEIATALLRAMNDDPLINAAAERNLRLVKQIANRSEVRQRVLRLYQSLAN